MINHSVLHVTNGESVRIDETGLPGEVLCWVDALHEGPVLPALSLDELSTVRAQFITKMGWGPEEEVRSFFSNRNHTLRRFREFEELVLWFEHDLFDQLQLIQILDFLLTQNRSGVKLSLICVGKFPGIGRFKGLGQLSAQQLGSLFDQRQEITLADLKLAAEAWHAFSRPDPAEIGALIAMHSTGLPYLKGALARHLEQFPSLKTGLSRTERQILEVVIEGVNRTEDVYLVEQDKEERVFMGDTIFWHYVDRLKNARVPLLESKDNSLRVTAAGHKVLVGNEDAVALNGIDRWLGGVYLGGPEAEWRWDERNRRVVRKENGFANRN